MKIKKKKLIFYILVTAFVCMSIWWVFHFPYSRERLYGVLPADAILISEHLNVNGRWKTAAQNAVIQNIGKSLLGSGAIEEITSDPGIKWLVKILGSRISVASYSPPFGLTGKESWTFACWAGGYTQLMRWGLFNGMLSDFQVINVGRRKIWTLRCNETTTDLYLSLAIEQGIVVGSLSSDPCSVIHPVERIAHTSPLTPFCRQIVEKTEEQPSQIYDRSWLRTPDKNSKKHLGSNLYSDAVITQPGKIEGCILTDAVYPGITSTLSNHDLDYLSKILNDIPDSLLVTQAGNISVLLSEDEALRQYSQIWNTISNHADPDAGTFAFIAGGVHSGRLMGMSVPTLCAGIKLKNPERANDLIRGLADKLNALFKLGLLPVPAKNHPGVTVMDFIKKKRNSLLQPQLRVSFGLRKDWLIACTSIKTLEWILKAKYNPQAELPIWRQIAGTGERAAYGWCDPKATGAILHGSLAVYTLITQFSSNSNGDRIYNDQTKLLINAFQTLENISFRLISADDGMQLKCEVTAVLK